MSEDKNKVEETTEEETLEENEFDTEQEVDLSDENQKSNELEDDEQSDDEGIDYKGEYERLEGLNAKKNERIDKQDKKILKLKKRLKGEDEDDEEEEEVPDMDSLVEQKVQKQMSALVEDTIEEELDNVSSNEDEKKLIEWYFENRIVKDGWSRRDIREYISDAKALANKGKDKSKIIKKKEQSDNTSGKPNFAGTPPKKTSQKVTEYDKKMARQYFKGDVKKWLKYKSN